MTEPNNTNTHQVARLLGVACAMLPLARVRAAVRKAIDAVEPHARDAERLADARKALDGNDPDDSPYIDVLVGLAAALMGRELYRATEDDRVLEEWDDKVAAIALPVLRAELPEVVLHLDRGRIRGDDVAPWMQWRHLNEDRMREAYEECDRCELLLAFLVGQGVDRAALAPVAVDMIGQAGHLAPTLEEGQGAKLMRIAEFAHEAIDGAPWAENVRTAADVGRAADELGIPAGTVRTHIPWEAIPGHEGYDQPAPWGRRLDATPEPAELEPIFVVLDGSTAAGIDPERVLRAVGLIIEEVASRAPAARHSRPALERARQHLAAPGGLGEAMLALDEACSPAISPYATIDDDVVVAARRAGAAAVAGVAWPILARELPEAVALVREHAPERVCADCRTGFAWAEGTCQVCGSTTGRTVTGRAVVDELTEGRRS